MFEFMPLSISFLQRLGGPSFSQILVPRPTICLNSVIEFIRWSNTISFTIQVLRYFMCNFSDSVFYDDVVIIVGIIIDAVFYKIAVYISLSFDGSPFVTDICSDIDNLKWSKESVFNALP